MATYHGIPCPSALPTPQHGSNATCILFNNVSKTDTTPYNRQSKLGHIDDQYNTPIRAYLDDIIITAPTKELHNLLMEATTDILAEDRFTVNPGKCFTGYHNIQILGHILGKSQIKPTNKRL